MADLIYRYTFQESVPVEEVEDTLVLAIIATESLHGEGQVLLDMVHTFDAPTRSCVIDAGTPVGRDVNKLFLGLVSREFGRGSFQVDRVAARPEPATV
jgi:hypothetical protein